MLLLPLSPETPILIQDYQSYSFTTRLSSHPASPTAQTIRATTAAAGNPFENKNVAS